MRRWMLARKQILVAAVSRYGERDWLFFLSVCRYQVDSSASGAYDAIEDPKRSPRHAPATLGSKRRCQGRHAEGTALRFMDKREFWPRVSRFR